MALVESDEPAHDGWFRWRPWFMYACLLLVFGAVAAALFMITNLRQDWSEARAALMQAQDRTANEAAVNIDRVIGEVEGVAHEAASAVADLPTFAESPGQAGGINRILMRLISRNPDIAAIGIAFEPFAYDPRYRLAAPIVVRTEHGFHYGRMEEEYDYTAPTVSWYRTAMTEGAVWDKTRTDPASGEKFVDFALRVKLETGRNAVAVVRISYPMERISKLVTHLDLGHHGYGVLISKEGRALVSPGLADGSSPEDGNSVDGNPVDGGPQDMAGDDEHLDGAAVDTVGAPLDQGLGAAIVRARLQDHVADFHSALTGHDSRLVTRRIKGPDWVLATVCSWHDLKLDFNARHQKIMLLTVLAVLLPVLLGGAHIAGLSNGPANRAVKAAWIWSTLSAFVFVAGISTIWALTLEGPGTLLASGKPIASRGALDGFKRGVLRNALEEGRALPVFVPTGIFVQSIEFLSANNLVLTGYVWQRYNKSSPLNRGFVMPEAEEADITEVFRHETEQEEVIGWRIRVVLRQSFSYARFPFDRESVWIRLWPADLQHSVVLVPDFAAYKITNPSAMPGLERSLFISGWSPVSTFFEYRRNGYTADFGIDASMSHGGRQELYFNVEIVRNFLDPFVSHITPILLVLLLIFAMQMTVTRHVEQKDLLGFNAATIITTCAALFFAVLISHIEVRGALAAKRIFYGEYFYLITYAVILAACINAILFTHDSNMRWIQYRDNLLPKLLYWPVVMTAMYAVTFFTFY